MVVGIRITIEALSEFSTCVKTAIAISRERKYFGGGTKKSWLNLGLHVVVQEV